MLIYNSNYEYGARYQVDDENMIRSAVKAIEKIQMTGNTIYAQRMRTPLLYLL